MVYTRAWDETQPPGTALAASLDTIIQNFKTDTRERVAGIFGLSLGEFSADPIVPKSLSLSVGYTGNMTGNVTGNVTGNLTGSILTAAQPNITSLGALTSLNMAGDITIPNGNGYYAKRNTGAAAVKVFGYDAGTDDLSTVMGGTIWRVRDTGAGVPMSLTAVGVLSSSGGYTGTINTAAQPNITSLGTQVVALTSSAALILGGTGRGVNYQYMNIQNTGTTIFMGIESSGGGSLIAGTAAYSSVLGNLDAHSLHFATNSVVRQTIDSAGNVVFTGTVTAANFVGPTTLDANNLTGTTLNAGVVNSSLTSVGILTGLTIRKAAAGSTLILDDTAGYNAIQFQLATVVKAFIGVDSGNALLAGSTAGDLVIRSEANNIRFTINGGTSAIASITTGGFTGNLVGNVTGTILTAAQGNITSLGTLTGLIVNGGFKNTGTPVARFETTGGAPSGGVGIGVELYTFGMQTYNRTTSAYANMNIDGADILFNMNGGSGKFGFGTSTFTNVGVGGIAVVGNSRFDGQITALTGALGQTLVTYTPTANGEGQSSIRVQNNAAGTGADAEAPRINFWWNARASSMFRMNATGVMEFVDSLGTSYAPIKASSAVFTSTVSGITTLTATTLTGTLSTASQTNVTTLGVLTGLAIASNNASDMTIGGSPTRGLQILVGAGSVNAAFGTQFSGGYAFVTHNAAQTTKDVDSWTQQLGTIASSMIEIQPNFIKFYNAVIGKATDTRANFWGTEKFSFNTNSGILILTSVTGDLTGNVTGTILTAAQANITSLGTLTALTISGNLTFTNATARIIPGATSLTFRNNANNADIMSLGNAGTVTFAGTGGANPSIDLINTGSLAVNGTKVIGIRVTGWAASTATLSRTAIANADTLAQTISHLAALKEDLQGHGLIGA